MSDEPKLLFCGVRDGVDFWHLECRFEGGQKYAAVKVDKDHEKLADEIAVYLNTRKEKEQAQGLAEIRIRQLGEQLAACEKALAERDARVLGLSRDAGRLADEVDALIRSKVIDSRSPVADALLDFREPPSTPRSDRLADLDKIVWGLVHNAGRCITSGRVERWAAVMEAVGCGSTQAYELCRQHGADPDQMVGEEPPPDEDEDEEDAEGSQETKRDQIIAALKASGRAELTGQLSLGHWDCEKSPTGKCAYDVDEDPCYDDCLFCHEPDERK